MKIAFINLFAPFTGSKYTSGLVYIEPLGLEYVAAVAKQAGHDVEIFAPEPSEDLQQFGQRIAAIKPEIIGIGPSTYNFNQAKALSEIVKRHNNKTISIFGGYHVTALPDSVLDPAIDIAIQGEGEYAFTEVVDCFERGVSYENVQGISFKQNGKLVVTPRRPRIEDLDQIPFPFRAKQDMLKYKCSGVYSPPKSRQISVAQIANSRGCPHGCSYCSSKNMWGSSVVYRQPARVVDEMEFLVENFNTNLIFFSDLTFNLNKKKVIALCNEIIKRDLSISWFCGCRSEGIDEEIVSAMKAAGCSRMHFGIEALDEVSLKEIRRLKTFGTVEKALEIASKAGIITRAYLMIGYPWETRQQLETVNDTLNKLHIDDLRISYYTPFPGTTIKRDEDQILTDNWDDYTTDKPIFKLKDMDREELISLRDSIFSNFYRSQSYNLRYRDKINAFPHLRESFEEFFTEINLPLRMSRVDFKEVEYAG